MKEPTISTVQCGRKDSGYFGGSNAQEMYKFLKGPDFAMLSLFDCDVRLPENTITNVTTDGLLMSYGDHEIIIRKTKILSDDIIEV